MVFKVSSCYSKIQLMLSDVAQGENTHFRFLLVLGLRTWLPLEGPSLAVSLQEF